MSTSTTIAGLKSRHNRSMRISPITRAVRAALAVSTIALAGTGVAFAGDCGDAAHPQTVLRCPAADSTHAPVADLTAVSGRQVPASVVASDARGLGAADALALSVHIVNRGTISKSGSGDVIGIDADFPGADISIRNTRKGDIQVESVDGLADGIFGYGESVSVDNRGTIDADGYTWGAGIEAEGDGVTVSNRGDISASASANVFADPYAGTPGIYGSAYGVYAVGYADDGVDIHNRGTINASAVYATGVYAYDLGTGGIGIDNRGDIVATAEYGLAAGVRAISNWEDSDVDVANRGSISAIGRYGATAVDVLATGLYSSASVDNRGDIYAAATEYYSLVQGIAISADDDASLSNHGSITIGYGDYAYGGMALAFAGDADIDNSGDVVVHGGLDAHGFVAASTNGQTSVVNRSSITTDSTFGDAVGIDASSLTGTDVRNEGDISATATKYAYGVLAHASQGDAEVDNRGSIATDGKYSFGVFARSVDGDALVDNRGDIVGAGKYAYGVVAGSTYGDAVISNAKHGAITGYSSDLLAVGAFVNAQHEGSATIDNRGAINAVATTYAQLAYGAVVQTVAGDALVDNRGSISADNSYSGARGVIVRSSGGGDAAVVNRGDISAVSTGSGVYVGYYGSYTVNTDVIGVYASAPDATASVDNRGSITASTLAGQATGIQASGGGDVTIDNRGPIAAYGYSYGFGIYAQSINGLVSITNAGDIRADATDIAAIGVYGGGLYGDVALDNAARGSISAYSANGTASALAGASYYGNVTASNAGVLDAYAAHADMPGTLAAGMLGNTFAPNGGDVTLINASSGSISATANNTTANGMMALSYVGDVNIVNAGDITASGDGAAGIYVYTVASAVDIDNRGSITAASDEGLADGIFAAGAVVEVANSGSISASGYTWADGIEAQGGGVTVSNRGDISASASANVFADPETGTAGIYGTAYGVYALSDGDGGVAIDNRGTISASAVYATGVYAYDGGTGGIGISNRGDISASADYGLATGISAASSLEGSNIQIDNRGSVAATAYYAAVGVAATASGLGSRAAVSNSGDVNAVTAIGYAAGIVASGSGESSLHNEHAGTIYASGEYAYGAMSLAFAGDANVTNAGDITVNAIGGLYAYGYGALSASQNGTATVNNSGDISVAVDALIPIARGIDTNGVDAEVVNRGTVEASGKYTRGISAVATTGDAEVRNTDSVYADGKYTYGVAGTSTGGDVRITNGGNGVIDASSSAVSISVLGISTYDDVEIVNAGSLVAHGDAAGLAANVYASSDNNDVEVTNRGSMDASAMYGNTFGVLANIGSDDELSVLNRGDIAATSGYYNATGIDATSAYGGEVDLRNAGAITAVSTGGDATGMAGAVVGGELALVNTRRGSINASTVYGDATGMLGVITNADVTVTNAGSITVSSVNGTAAAIRIVSGAPLPLAPTGASGEDSGAAGQPGQPGQPGDARQALGIAPLVDRGLLVATGAQPAGATATVAVASTGTGTATVTNRGSIAARSAGGQAFAVYGGDGVEQIFNHGSISGAIVTHGGDDSMWNRTGGVWQVAGKGTDFGAGDDLFNNARGATLELANAGIAFGTGDNRFVNQGMIVVSGVNRVDMIGGHGGTAAFTNNGTIDFLDGAADDRLTINGRFGGQGAINLDVSLDHQRTDQLLVHGSAESGTHQVVNVMLLDGLPKADDVGTDLQLVHVSGDTSPSAFVAGSVLGVSPRDFLSVGMSLSAQPDATTLTAAGGEGGSSYMLSVETFVSGLNAAGVLASSTALAVDNLMSSTIGGHGERTYMYALAPDGQPMRLGLTPWVRTFSGKVGMNPEQLAGNFGELAHSRLNQTNFGSQIGMEYRAGNGLRVGTVFAKSEGRQYLVDDHGRNIIRGRTMGLYGAWVSPAGFYVNATWQSMNFHATMNSGAGPQRGDGHAASARLELGKAWTLDSGLTVAPRMRLTATRVDGLSIAGDQATFAIRGAQWRRVSAGVALRKTFLAGGWQWMPYGEVNLVDTLHGVTQYAINRQYFGSVRNEGTSALVTFGIGARKGQLSWSGALNWRDSARLDGGLGGQISVQYAW